MSLSQPLAKRILEVLPPLVHKVRTEARSAYKDKITLPRIRILASIHYGINTVGGIAELRGVAQPTISKMVESLAQRGMIRRVHDSEDKRQVTLELTKKGASTFMQAQQTIQTKLSHRFDGLTEVEKKKAVDCLDQLESLLIKRDSQSDSR